MIRFPRLLFIGAMALMSGCAHFSSHSSKPVAQTCPVIPVCEPKTVEIQCPEVNAVAPVALAQQLAEPKVPDEAVVTVDADQAKMLVGSVEQVELIGVGVVVDARIDSGAAISSINAQDQNVFERDGERWMRFSLLDPATSELITLEKPIQRYKKIKQLGGKAQKRAVVRLPLRLGRETLSVDVTLSNRQGYNYQVLIGRNVLRDRALVDVSQKYMLKPVANTSEVQ